MQQLTKHRTLRFTSKLSRGEDDHQTFGVPGGSQPKVLIRRFEKKC